MGRELDGALHQRLSEAADIEAAYKPLLRALEVGPMPKKIRPPAAAEGPSRPAVEAALERAAELGILDDAAFARN